MNLQPDWLVIVEVVVGYLLAFLTILRIVLQRREPTATLAGVAGILLLPYIGVLLYLLVGRRRLNRQIRRRQARYAALEPLLGRPRDSVAGLAVPGPQEFPQPGEKELVLVSDRVGTRVPTYGNRVELLEDAVTTYQSMEQAIAAAQDHVHLLYYILQPDHTGQRFLDLLVRKAQEGIEVRVLTDGVGSFGADVFMTPLVQAGGKHAEFLPVGTLSRHWHPNLRNHRKIVVIDGKVGFTGGVNIGDEYTGRKLKVGPWRDTHLRIQGPAVNHLQEVFAEDWYFATGVDLLVQDRYFPDLVPEGDQVVQIIASGPDTDTQPIHRVIFTAVTLAQQRVFLTTPYFVPDQALLVALETAAMRGIDVRLMLPHRSDMRLALHAGRSYYDQLLGSGVKIYEYASGILHAKSLVVDDRWATVGSANMDVRSFRLNFEVNAVIYGERFTSQLTELFNKDLGRARQITEADRDRRRVGSRVAESLARVLSPVL